MAVTLDDNDPCTTAQALRQAYADLIAGEKAQSVIFRSGPTGVAREVTYSKADPSRLLALVREWEAKCAALQGKAPRRFALRAGGIY